MVPQIEIYSHSAPAAACSSPLRAARADVETLQARWRSQKSLFDALTMKVADMGARAQQLGDREEQTQLRPFRAACHVSSFGHSFESADHIFLGPHTVRSTSYVARAAQAHSLHRPYRD